MSAPLIIKCSKCDWTPPVAVYTLESALDVLQGHHQRSHMETRAVVVHDGELGSVAVEVLVANGDGVTDDTEAIQATIDAVVRGFQPPVMTLDSYPALPDHPVPAPWWHWHRAKSSHQFGRFTAQACRCGALRITGPTYATGYGHTPIPAGWPEPNTGWAYAATPKPNHGHIPTPPPGPGGGSRP